MLSQLKMSHYSTTKKFPVGLYTAYFLSFLIEYLVVFCEEKYFDRVYVQECFLVAFHVFEYIIK